MVVDILTAAYLVKDTAITTTQLYRKIEEHYRDETPRIEFEEQLSRRIEQRAEEIESSGLRNVVQHWSAITSEINTYKGVFNSESEVIEYIMNEIKSHVSLTEGELNDLQIIIADEYSDAVNDFKEEIGENDTLQNKFETELGIEVIEKLNSLERYLNRIAEPSSYDLFKFPEERGKLLEKLQSGEDTSFVDRNELPDEPDLDRYVVIGSTGSGKTRLIHEWVRRLPDNAVDHVLLPKQHFLSQGDATSIERKTFDGELLVVWEDIHRVNPNAEGNVVKRTLGYLLENLNQGQELYTLLEARSGRIKDLSDTLPNGFDNENVFWHNFEPLYLDTLDEDDLTNLVLEFEELFDNVWFTDAAVDTLVSRIRNIASAPQYIETVVKTSSGEITEEDIVDLPRKVENIWSQEPYPKLREESISEWHVLASMKLLYDLRVPLFLNLVQSVYVDYLESDQTLFYESVEDLENRRWVLTLRTEGDFEEEILYAHDTQLEPISINADDRPRVLSDFLLGEIDRAVPVDVREQVHLFVGGSMFGLQEYSAARDHWKAACDIGENAVSYYNYGYILSQEFGEHKEALSCFEKAFKLDSEYVEARTSYGVLLMDQFDRLDEAGKQLRQALKIDAGHVNTHINYARLLRKRDKIKDAKWHLEQAMCFDPEEPESFYLYGKLMNEEFDDRQEAEKFWAEAFSLNESYAEKLLNNIRYMGQYGQHDFSFKSERQRVSEVPEEAEFGAYVPPTTRIEVTLKQADSEDTDPIESQRIELKSGVHSYGLDELQDMDGCWLWAEFRLINEYGILSERLVSFPNFIEIGGLPDDLPISFG